LLHYIALTNGRGLDGHPLQMFTALSREVDSLNHTEIIAAAKRAREISSELNRLAWQIVQAAKRVQVQG
jgi:hypothetical protein